LGIDHLENRDGDIVVVLTPMLRLSSSLCNVDWIEVARDWLHWQ